ncbi:methyltransferase [Candidatus Woesearchaeota archaeon]|nr:methyltransferase [Candidatus Woesearchaeota archaeon]
MILKFNSDLTKQEIYANGDDLSRALAFDKDGRGRRVYSWPKEKKKLVVTFKNPLLVTDSYKISQLNPTLRDTVFALFSYPLKITEYENTSLEFEQQNYPGVWGPSIDTLLFCKALKKLNSNNFKTAIEMGCGSGFISKYLINNSKIKRMDLADLNKYAIKCAKNNIKNKKAKFHVGDALKFLKNKKYDLILCNPPYIPRPKSIDDNPYEGIYLLNYLITKAKNNLTKNGVIITNISSLCEHLVKPLAKENNVKITILESLEVPLKVYNVLNNPAWMKYLLKRGLKKQLKQGYEYWQKINIVKIHKTKSI